MSVVRVAFLGTPEFASYHLQHLFNDEHYKVVGVVTQPDRKQGRKMKLTPSPVKKLAIEQNVPCISPEKFNDNEVYQTVQSWKPEYIVVVAYGQIISKKFLEMYPQKVVNVHASLLPKWRGAAPIQRSLMAGDVVTGVSLQVMVKKLDAGDVIGERTLTVQSHVNAIELHDDLKVLGADLLHVEFMDYIRGHLSPVVQDESKVTYAKKIEKSESHIDWSLKAQDIHNKVRGMQLGPGTYTTFQDKKIKIHQTEVVDLQENFTPGLVISNETDELVIACAENALKVLTIQPESRARMPITDFLKGHPIMKGESFG